MFNINYSNHPLAHLTQSVFGFHDRTKFDVYVYATSSSDGSSYRQKIQEESHHFLNVSSWSTREIVEGIIMDGIHLRTGPYLIFFCRRYLSLFSRKSWRIH